MNDYVKDEVSCYRLCRSSVTIKWDKKDTYCTLDIKKSIDINYISKKNYKPIEIGIINVSKSTKCQLLLI